MSAFNLDWSRASELVSLFQTGLEAVKRSTGQALQSQLTTLGLHIKPGVKPFKEIVGQFVNAKALGASDAAMYGVSVTDYSFVIDSSGVVPGGIFIKLIRSFKAENRLKEMAAVLYKDEENELRHLGLEIQ